MKKRFVLGLTGIMVLSMLAGCSKSSTQSSEKGQSSSSQSSSQYLLDIDYSEYVTLCEYKGAAAEKVLVEVTDDNIKEEVENRMYDYATYDTVTNRGIQDGDLAVIDYTATMDGKESETYSREEEEVLVGEGYVFPELEEALVGMKTGESKDVEVKITEDFAEDEQDTGKKLSLKATVGEITIENLPEYNEAFVKENTDYSSTADYEAAIKEELKEEKEEDYKYQTVGDIVNYLVENSEFNGYPDELYEKCEKEYNSNVESSAEMFGMETEEYLELAGIDEETKKEEIKANVNYELVIGCIAQKEKLGCTDEEIDEFVKNNYEDYEYESEEEFLQDYPEEEIGYNLVYEKVISFLYDNAKLTEISEEEFLQEHEEDYGEEEAEEPEGEESEGAEESEE